MTITKRGFICLAAGMLAASLFAGHHHHRPFPPGTPPGAYWCEKCGGDGYNWTWYGWKKTCGICDGRGWLVKRLPPAPPPKPVVAPHPHHGKPAPKPAPKPTPMGGPKGGPKGGPRR